MSAVEIPPLFQILLTSCRFTCPYHGWTYGLDGRLTRANRLRDIKEFKTKDFGLKPMSVAEWGPLVFVNADAGADSGSYFAPKSFFKPLNLKFRHLRTLKNLITGSLTKAVSDLPTNDLFSPEMKWMKRVVFPGGDPLISNNISKTK